MAVTDGELKVAERIGKFKFSIRRAEDTPDTRERWARRSEALTAWLLAEWRREHGEEGRN
jgi:hypothetical protein